MGNAEVGLGRGALAAQRSPRPKIQGESGDLLGQVVGKRHAAGHEGRGRLLDEPAGGIVLHSSSRIEPGPVDAGQDRGAGLKVCAHRLGVDVQVCRRCELLRWSREALSRRFVGRCRFRTRRGGPRDLGRVRERAILFAFRRVGLDRDLFRRARLRRKLRNDARWGFRDLERWSRQAPFGLRESRHAPVVATSPTIATS